MAIAKRGAATLNKQFSFVMTSVLCVAAGCAPFHKNQPLARHDRQGGYRFDLLATDDTNTDSLFVALTFSGGGTRAAAFAYGVLAGLRDTPLPPDGKRAPARRLIDEVDLISAVSGGSFTAVAFALWRDRIFDGAFERRFLKRNTQLMLLLDLLKPMNLLRLPFVLLDRTDVAANYYDEEVFDGATYGDLIDDGRRPFVVVNATDVARRQRFSFTQGDFDLLGSDLALLPVGWATAASSAFPILLSPIRLKYFHGDALRSAIQRVVAMPESLRPPRRQRWAKSLFADREPHDAAEPVIDERNHKYLYLLDGGLADNLGLSAFIESYRRGAIRRRIVAGRIEKLVLVIVDAATEPPEDLERKPASPGLLKIGATTGTTGMDNHSAALSSMVKYMLLETPAKIRRAYRECREAIDEQCPSTAAPCPPNESLVDAYVIDLSFQQIEATQRRKGLLSMATSFFLPGKDIEALITTGRELLAKHPEYKRLMRDLEQTGG